MFSSIFNHLLFRDSIRIHAVIDSKQYMNTGISFGQQSARWLVARLLMKSCLLAVGVAFLQISFVGGQVQAQPIFRTPQAASPVVAPKLQLTAPSNLKMAPIRNVGLGEVSSSPFQLPQTEQPRGFFQPTPAVQSDSVRGQELSLIHI